MELFLIPLMIVALLMLPFIAVFKKHATGKQTKTALIVNLCSFFGVLALAVVLPIGGFIDAAEVTDLVNNNAGLGYLAAALATGLGSIGCGIAVAAAAPAAIGAVAEEPKSFAKSLIFVALGEGVALYGFLISFMILNKL